MRQWLFICLCIFLFKRHGRPSEFLERKILIILKISFSPTTQVQVEERFVVEIKIVNCPGLIYMTRNGKYESFILLSLFSLIFSLFISAELELIMWFLSCRCYFRQKSRNEEVSMTISFHILNARSNAPVISSMTNSPHTLSRVIFVPLKASRLLFSLFQSLLCA